MAVVALGGVACGASRPGSAGGPPRLVVTTAILGDVVREVVGAHADVDVLMPSAASPHEFQPSAQQVAAVRKADAVVANGGGLEAGLDDVLAAAEADGVPVFRASGSRHIAADAEVGSEVEPPEPDDGHAASHDHEHDEGADHHDHTADAHFFTSPERMIDAVVGLVAFLDAEVDGVDIAAVRAGASRYVDELRTLDEEVSRILDVVPAGRRVLVTNHDVLGAFADRYGFEVVGTVLPSNTTTAGASASGIATLAQVLRDRSIPTVFVDASSSDRLARSLSEEVPGVVVVPLNTEALGADADTYIEMVRVNARRIADALR